MSTGALWLRMGWTMLHFLWVGTAIGALGAVALRATRGSAPQPRYKVALATLAMLALAPVAIAWHLKTRAHGDAAPAADHLAVADRFTLATEHPVPHRASSLGTDAPDVGVGRAVPPIPRVRGESPATATSRLDLAAAWLPWLWVVGSPLTFLRLACGLVGAERLRRRSQALADRGAVELCGRLARALGMTRRVSLAACDRLAAPVLVGAVRPLILLPAAAMSGWSPEQLEMVLLHELAHARHWDNLVNLLQRLVESVLFFHPAVWVVSAWVRREREHCCDRIVVERTGRPHAYVETLLALSAPAPNPSHRIGLAMARGPLVGRVRRILELGADRHPMKLPFSLLVPAGCLLIMPAWLVLPRAQEAVTRAEAGSATVGPEPSELMSRSLELVMTAAPVRGAEGRTIRPIVDIAAARARMGDRAGALEGLAEGMAAQRDRESKKKTESVPPKLEDKAIDGPDPKAIANGALEVISKVVPSPGSERGTLFALADIARAQAESGDRAGALATFRRCLERIEGISDPAVRAQMSRYVIQLISIAGETDMALELAGKQPAHAEGVDGSPRAELFMLISFHLTSSGDIARARQVADRIEDRKMRGHALLMIARAEADRGEPDAAARTVESIELLRIRIEALTGPWYDLDGWGTSQALARRGDLAGARKALLRARMLAEKLPDGPDKDDALTDLAVAHARNGDIAAGLGRARSLMTEPNRSNALGEIAGFQAKAGAWDDAFRTAEQVTRPEARTRALRLIADAQVKAGRQAAALATYRKALESSPRPDAVELSRIAEGQARAGDVDACRATLRRGGVAGTAVLPEVAVIQAQAGDFRAARETADRIEDEHARADAFASIAFVQAEAGHGADALRWAEELNNPRFAPALCWAWHRD
jgi:beta-lactamase regulating signal transducer with metallopeptidase domain/tetratricopeptide (TPR) repeat protein